MERKLFNRTRAWDLTKEMTIITLGIATYCFGWAVFLLPYHIPTGGMAGMAAILQYYSGFPMQYTILMVNALLLIVAWWKLGAQFALKTAYAVSIMSFFLGIGQDLMKSDDGKLFQILGEDQDSMACLLGAIINGIGIGIIFISGGSTGGWDIIAALVNKYRNISLGRVMLFLDFFVIASCYFLFKDWRMVVFGYVTLIVYTLALDMLVNSSKQDVQFTIYTKMYSEISEEIRSKTGHTMTLLYGEGGYTHEALKVLVTIVHKREQIQVLHLIRDIDPNAFVTLHRVEGVYGKGFNIIKP